MKTKIKVKLLNKNCAPIVNLDGDWIDLKAACNIELRAPQAGVQYQQNGLKYRDVNIPVIYIPLGVAIELPKGYEAIVASRSSGPKKLGLFIPSGQGIIDESFCGDTDEWHYVASPLNYVKIKEGDRICQFRIQLNQKATFWQKIKWLFSSGIEVVFVDSLNNKSRGGLGSTGI